MWRCVQPFTTLGRVNVGLRGCFMRSFGGSNVSWARKRAEEPVSRVLDAQEEAAVAEALAAEEAKQARKEARTRKSRVVAKDVTLPQSSAESHSTEVYSELVRSNILANNPKDATEILEKMPEQGFVVSAGLCNSLMLLWLEQPVNGLKQAARVLQLMQTHKIRKNERSVAIGLMIALGRQDHELIQELVSYSSKLSAAEKSSFELARVSRYFFQHGGVAKADAAKVFLERQNNEVLREILDAARSEADQAALTTQQPVESAPPLPEEESLDPLYRAQLNLETRAATDAVQKYRDSLQEVINLGRGANTRPAHDVLLLWSVPFWRCLLFLLSV
jgi:hypothetical protein